MGQPMQKTVQGIPPCVTVKFPLVPSGLRVLIAGYHINASLRQLQLDMHEAAWYDNPPSELVAIAQSARN